MSFKKARNVLYAAVILFFVFAVSGLMMPDGSALVGVFTLLTLLCAGISLGIYIVKGSCPHCGKPLHQGLFFLSTCPYCKKSLYAPVKRDDDTERKL